LAAAQRPLVEQLASLTAQVARDKGISVEPLRSVLVRLGEKGFHDFEIPARLEAAADQLIEMRAQLTRLRNSSPEISSVRQETIALIDRGDLEGARAALDRGRSIARGLREQANRNEAELLADEARIYRLEMSHQLAAKSYGEAAAIIGSSNPLAQAGYLANQATELHEHGRLVGDNKAIADAVALLDRAISLAPRDIAPDHWSHYQNLLGIALLTLGSRETMPETVEASLRAFRCALSERSVTKSPLDWAIVQHNVANALSELGERSGESSFLHDAVAAHRLALSAMTRDNHASQWAVAHRNLASVLRKLGERGTGSKFLEEALTAYRQALLEQSHRVAPLEWASTQEGIGTTLLSLGDRERGTRRYEEALTAFQEALLEYKRERRPIHWAMTQNNIGNAFLSLARREEGAEPYNEAINAYHQALLEYTQDRTPFQWAMVMNNLGNALVGLAKRGGTPEMLEQAVSSFRQALSVFTRDHLPMEWAATQLNLGSALGDLGNLVDVHAYAARAGIANADVQFQGSSSSSRWTG
jgi:tetratricopeptide (TPR) repeat protein